MKDEARAGDVPTTGTVYLVGAGPGNPGLLTVRAREILERCDAVVYDRLAAGVLPAHLPASTELHYCGKRAGQHSMRQDEINQLLVRLARQGKAVCRLKGGDPFVFGRGGEEAETLRAAGLRFEVVPGVTAGIAAAAYAGIPVTRRGEVVRVCLVTAHEDPTKGGPQVDWRAFGHDPHGTVAAYMPMANLAGVLDELIAGGLDPATPAAVIERGTLPGQRTVAGTLTDLPAVVQAADVRPPAILLVGKTVALHERLAWHDEPALAGRRVVVTRPADQAGPLLAALTALGIEPVVFPTIRTESASESELVSLASQLADYDWVFFTSENGVRHFFPMLLRLGLDVRTLGRARLAAVGSGTAARLLQHGLHADFVPTVFRSKALLREFRAAHPVDGKRILRIRGDNAPAKLEADLRVAGARVDCLTAYRVLPAVVRPDVLDDLSALGADAAAFTSGSAVESFENLAPDHGLHAAVPAVCIGPVTAGAAERAGWKRVVTPEVSNLEGLVQTVQGILSEDSPSTEPGPSR